MDSKTRKYLSEIGRKGGKKSKRVLTPEQARKMVEAREQKKRDKQEQEKKEVVKAPFNDIEDK